jgi:hypothetical protein
MACVDCTHARTIPGQPGPSFFLFVSGPAAGQPPELRDGFRIDRLVMSINRAHVS